MENFDEKKIYDLAEIYAYVIEGGLALSWGVSLETIKKDEKKNIEFIKSQFIFLSRNLKEEEWENIQNN